MCSDTEWRYAFPHGGAQMLITESTVNPFVRGLPDRPGVSVVYGTRSLWLLRTARLAGSGRENRSR